MPAFLNNLLTYEYLLPGTTVLEVTWPRSNDVSLPIEFSYTCYPGRIMGYKSSLESHLDKRPDWLVWGTQNSHAFIEYDSPKINVFSTRSS